MVARCECGWRLIVSPKIKRNDGAVVSCPKCGSAHRLLSPFHKYFVGGLAILAVFGLVGSRVFDGTSLQLVVVEVGLLGALANLIALIANEHFEPLEESS